MPKSKRAKTYHLTQVTKKTREQKEQLFQNIRATVPDYKHCFVLGFDNMRNNHLKDVRREMVDSRIFFGKTKLMSRALGTDPSTAVAENIHRLSRHITGSVALLFTNRTPEEVAAYFASFAPVDFARAGAVATRDFVIPPGVVYATGGAVPAEHDVPLGHTIEPELRRLGVPTRMVRGKVVLGEEDGAASGAEGYTVCKEGQTLDSRQTRLLKLFDQCLSEFRVRVLAYWSSDSGEVTEVDPVDENAMEGVEEEEDE
ncbi:mRNA turnover protein 4 [Cryphonectria parasitica EP155]|uniref:Ribosome assembly factor mrt4 n=1 Tax=Cryphonectria parasitica (strain ATCC 38755 / EP155) TaxID=660469 RepID=A0A9P4YC42_CRYP1|nr:mRNA turnover protein 4 [Cryphonectria parasitica EP155]KAF3770335.1 mRNA turnover protein 4 [Cryphonectria parasitica EP155]